MNRDDDATARIGGETSAQPALTTAALSDAMDRLGVGGTLPGLSALWPGQRLYGRAFTVRYVPAGSPPGTVGDYIDDVPAGRVVVLDNSGRTDCTVWGDILTAVATARHVGGTVIDGVCRDVAKAAELGYPIYSRGRFMRTGKDRVEVAGVGDPLSVAGIQVRAGDLLVGDDDGVVAVPARMEEEVLSLAAQIEHREDEILAEALRAGSLRDARNRFGYHELQRGG